MAKSRVKNALKMAFPDDWGCYGKMAENGHIPGIPGRLKTAISLGLSRASRNPRIRDTLYTGQAGQ